MNDLTFWFLARITGLTAFAVLSLAVLSGEALRTSVLDFLASNRAIRRLHDFTTPLWLPLVFAHLISLLLDKTAQIRPVDVVVPFVNPYEPYFLPIGLGTIAFDIIMVVTVTSWLKRRMNNTLWTWIHRTSYVAFVTLFLHALWSGTDFSAPLISALSWSAALGIGLLAVSRIVFGRLPE